MREGAVIGFTPSLTVGLLPCDPNEAHAMPDFKELQNQLQQARNSKEQARAELSEARERVKRIEAELARLQRAFNPDNEAHLQRRQTLERMKAEVEGSVKRREGLYAQA